MSSIHFRLLDQSHLLCLSSTARLCIRLRRTALRNQSGGKRQAVSGVSSSHLKDVRRRGLGEGREMRSIGMTEPRSRSIGSHVSSNEELWPHLSTEKV